MSSSAPSAALELADPDPRRGQIVAAACDLLGEAGLEGLTIRAVLLRTGLARRAFYECFPGKDELVLAMFEETIRDAANNYRDQFAPLADPIDRLEQIVLNIMLGGSSLPPELAAPANRRAVAMSREHLRLADSHPAALQRALSPLVGLIAGELAAGMAAGLVRIDDAERLAGFIFNLAATTVHSECLIEEDATPDVERRMTIARQIWQFCRRAIIA